MLRRQRGEWAGPAAQGGRWRLAACAPHLAVAGRAPVGVRRRRHGRRLGWVATHARAELTCWCATQIWPTRRRRRATGATCRWSASPSKTSGRRWAPRCVWARLRLRRRRRPSAEPRWGGGWRTKRAMRFQVVAQQPPPGLLVGRRRGRAGGRLGALGAGRLRVADLRPARRAPLVRPGRLFQQAGWAGARPRGAQARLAPPQPARDALPAPHLVRCAFPPFLPHCKSLYEYRRFKCHCSVKLDREKTWDYFKWLYCENTKWSQFSLVIEFFA